MNQICSPTQGATLIYNMGSGDNHQAVCLRVTQVECCGRFKQERPFLTEVVRKGFMELVAFEQSTAKRVLQLSRR